MKIRHRLVAVAMLTVLLSGCSGGFSGWGWGGWGDWGGWGGGGDDTSEPPVSDCHDIDDENGMVAKFEVVNGAYVFEKPAGNESVVTLSETSPTGGSWSSTVDVGAVIVKGGNGQFTQELSPSATSGSFDNSGLAVEGSPTPDISNIQFYCGDPSGDGGGDGCSWGTDWNWSWGWSWTG
jgi:hypothetical protein